MTSRTGTRELLTKLKGMTYESLFMQMSGDELNELWKSPGPAAFATVAQSSDSPEAARYLATEVLFRKDSSYKPMDRVGLARAYVKALRETGIANQWGMPGELDGESGRHLVELGEPAVSALIPLLTDDKRLEYAGSKEATVGNEYGMRVKDFAAFYISKIRKIEFVVSEDVAARNDGIEKLRGAL